MNSKDKIKQLRKIIEESLDSYIDRDYVFLDLPYHPNVGDTLIAMAAKNYLKRFPYKCLYYSSEFTFDNREIPNDILIIFNGGGNFGDLWQNYTDFRNSIIRKYPQNRYLILPQSVMYMDDKNLKADLNLFSSCPNITICARDQQSFSFLKKHFVKNNILLVPDMAFYADDNVFPLSNKKGKILFLRRDDKEFVDSPKYSIVPRESEIHDWPTLEKTTIPYFVNSQILKICNMIEKYINPKVAWKIRDLYWQKILHPYNVRSGFKFVGQYETVYTTRLHVAIISVLLGKKIYFFDNSYHKNSALYNTWLQDADNLQLVV